MNIDKKFGEIETELRHNFHDRHIQCGVLADSLMRLGYEKRSNRVFFCGTDLAYRIDPHTTNPPKLHKANFCKDRLCPMCGWRRSMKIFGQVSKIMDKLEKKYAFIFVTLTVRNCSSEQFPKFMKELTQSFNLFCKYKKVKDAFKGYFRAIEITRNPDLPESLEWHPHIHAIFACTPSYFTSKYYISHNELIKLWMQACHISYEPTVRIQKIHQKKNENSIKKAVCEVAKYPLKSYEYIRDNELETDRTINTLIHSISSHRLCSLGGVFKKVAKELKLDDITDGDLVNTDNETIRTDLAYIIAKYQWIAGIGYQQTAILTEEEYNDAL